MDKLVPDAEVARRLRARSKRAYRVEVVAGDGGVVGQVVVPADTDPHEG